MRALRVSLLLFTFSAGSGSAITVPELQDQFISHDASIRSLQFDFKQEVKSGLSKEKQSASGTAYFKKPKNLRIEQTDPENQVIVTSGKSVFIYTPRFKQAFKDSWSRWAQKNLFFPGLLGVSETFEKLKKDFKWEIGGVETLNGEKTWSVRLRGKSDEIKFWLGQTDFVPRKTEIISGTLTLTTTLASLQLNPELDAELFKFVPPLGTAIVKVP